MASNLMLRIASKWAKRHSFQPKWMRSSRPMSSSVSFAQTLSIPETNQTELKNGIRVVTEDTGSSSATVGVWIDAGTRYETLDNNGVANFVEHLILKGSSKRSTKQLESDVEQLGAVVNSYTNKEQTAFYIKSLSNDIPKAMQILSDLVSNTKFDENDVSSEREVILREIQELDTNYQEVVLNLLHSIAFQQTPLSFSRVGTTENVKKMNGNDLTNYVNTNFKGPRIVLSVAGGVDHSLIVKQANELFANIELLYDSSEIPLLKPCRFTGSDIRVRDDSMPLCHAAMAVEGVGFDNPDHIPLMIASQLMGSWDRTHGGGTNCSSYLAMCSATDNLSHSFQSFNLCYKDTGLFGLYFVSERLKLEDFSWHLQNEWRRLCTEVTDNELQRAKNLLMTNILLESEGSTSLADQIGRQVLSYGRRIPLPEMQARIQSVNAQKVRDVCSQYIWDRCPAVAAIGPVENLPLYEELRGKMSWVRY